MYDMFSWASNNGELRRIYRTSLHNLNSERSELKIATTRYQFKTSE